MSIYEVLARYYDDLFPAKEAAVVFLSKRIPPGGTVLDIGCGTGNHCFALAERGFQVVGIDPDPVMIETARKKASNDNPLFLTAGFEGVPMLGRQFDAVYCIGNTLPHLSDLETVAGSFHTVYDILVQGGTYVLQIVNYDRIVRDNVTSLPPLTGGEATLRRHYTISGGGGEIMFEIELEVEEKGSTKKMKDQVRLLPLLKNQLMEMAEAAGFTAIEVNGNYQGEGYTVGGSATILSLIK